MIERMEKSMRFLFALGTAHYKFRKTEGTVNANQNIVRENVKTQKVEVTK